jgi:hypothetical protein
MELAIIKQQVFLTYVDFLGLTVSW